MNLLEPHWAPWVWGCAHWSRKEVTKESCKRGSKWEGKYAGKEDNRFEMMWALTDENSEGWEEIAVELR